MASDKQPPRFLDQLRRQSDAVRQTQAAQTRPVEETLRAMDGQLWTAFRWLDEALRHLEVIRPRVQHAFVIMGVLSIDSPRYQQGFISYRRRTVASMELLEHVELFYRLAHDAPITLKVQPHAAAGVEDRLRSAHLQFRYDQELDEHRAVRSGTFVVQPEITASVRFEPDYRRQRVAVTLSNIDRFESVILDFAADALGEAALEDLVHFILGEHNQFLRRAPLAGVGDRSVSPVTSFAARKLASSRPAA